MKKLLLTGIAVLPVAFASAAHARPNLHTQSIGWMNPGDILCTHNSSGICEVTRLAHTWQEQDGSKPKYQIEQGTELLIIDEGKNNEPKFATRYKNENYDNGVYIYNKRVKVAIVVPSDWDTRPGHSGQLIPDGHCSLATHGENKSNIPPTISLDCSVHYCVSVIDPPPEVVKDPEFDPKSWLGLREKPNKQSRMTFRLGDHEQLWVDATQGTWTHISSVIRLTTGEHPRIVEGWVRSKYVWQLCSEGRS